MLFRSFNVALAGIISVFTTYLFASYIGYKDEYLSSGFFTYNPLLVGLSIGFLFKLNAMTILLLVAASVFAFIVTIVFANLFSVYLHLQILSIPFVIVSSIVYLASGRYSNLYVNSLYSKQGLETMISIPIWLTGYLKSLGAIIFMPDIISGALIALLLLFVSRILFTLSVLGFAVGCFVQGWFTGSFLTVFTDINSFNYILISMAIGGIYLVPSLHSFVFAIIGVTVSTLLISAVNVFWSQYGIPVFTLPFNLVTLGFVYVLGLINYEHRPLIYKPTPEQTLDHYLTTKNRGMSGFTCTVSLPFNGAWTVWQEIGRAHV